MTLLFLLLLAEGAPAANIRLPALPQAAVPATPALSAVALPSPAPAAPAQSAGESLRAAAPEVGPGAAPETAEDPGIRAAAAFDGVKNSALSPSVVADPRPLNRHERRTLRRLAAPWHASKQLAKIPAVPSGQVFRLALIGDAEEGRFWLWRKLFNAPGIFLRQLRRASKEDVHAIVQLGDHVSRGTVKHYLGLFRGLLTAGIEKPLLLMRGNHDGERPNGFSTFTLHRALIGLGDYVLDRGDWRIVFLDTANQGLSPDQLRWLDRQLDTPRRKLILTHVPPDYVAKTRPAWGPFRGLAAFKDGASAFRRIVENRGVSDVFFGHVHAYDETTINGVRYTLTGGGGSALFPGPEDRFHHYLVLEAGPDGLRKIVRRFRGVD